MKNKLVVVPNTKTLIKKSPGFTKKELSDYKIDLMALCGFGCRYCSSNAGNYLRIHRREFAHLTQEQLGLIVLPSEEPALSFEFTDVVEQLGTELSRKRKSYGEGKVLMFSMLTDAFSPSLVTSGVTRAALELLLEKTSFRIRILTKNAIVGSNSWVEFLARQGERVVVGLSTGTLDADWANKIEMGTSNPRARLRALRNLQDAGVPTFGMLCPVFPDVIVKGQLDELIDEIRPERCERVWAEPYNDRNNWELVRDAYEEGSESRAWMDKAFGDPSSGAWGEHATELYATLLLRSDAEGWTDKLRYMLYEGGMSAEASRGFCDLRGLLLQSPGDEDGLSKNAHFRALQQQIKPLNYWDHIDNPYV